MYRRLAPCVSLAAAALAAGVPARAQAPAPAPRLAATLASCETGTTAAERRATFTGSMPAGFGTQRMTMRFDLQVQRDGATRFATLAVPRWGRWERSRPDVSGFIFTKRVDGLVPPASYRAVVRFRWYDAQGRLLRRDHRVTGRCRQPDLRADLAVGPVGTDGQRYVVEVRNDGRGDAGPFLVAVRVADVVVTSLVDGLGAGGHRTLAVGGGRCRPEESVFVTIDGGRSVEESDEADNAVARPCPFAAAR